MYVCYIREFVTVLYTVERYVQLNLLLLRNRCRSLKIKVVSSLFVVAILKGMVMKLECRIFTTNCKLQLDTFKPIYSYRIKDIKGAKLELIPSKRSSHSIQEIKEKMPQNNTTDTVLTVQPTYISPMLLSLNSQLHCNHTHTNTNAHTQ